MTSWRHAGRSAGVKMDVERTIFLNDVAVKVGIGDGRLLLQVGFETLMDEPRG